MFIVAQGVSGTVKRTNVSFTNTINILAYMKKWFGSSWIFVTCFSSNWLSHNCFSNITNSDLISGDGFEDSTSFNLFLMTIFLA